MKFRNPFKRKPAPEPVTVIVWIDAKAAALEAMRRTLDSMFVIRTDPGVTEPKGVLHDIDIEHRPCPYCWGECDENPLYDCKHC